MRKHTKGPWYAASTGNHQGLIISEITGENIAVSYDAKDTPLIAAAPELLEALEDAQDCIQNMLDDLCSEPEEDIEAQATLAKIRTALNKAKGE